MLWIVFAVLQFVFIGSAVRAEKRVGAWSSSKFAFTLAFAALEFCLCFLPVWGVGAQSRWYGTVLVVAWSIAALNFIWFIIACRRWRMPDGRASLEVWEDVHERR